MLPNLVLLFNRKGNRKLFPFVLILAEEGDYFTKIISING